MSDAATAEGFAEDWDLEKLWAALRNWSTQSHSQSKDSSLKSDL
jgi:head-tail adaptor